MPWSKKNDANPPGETQSHQWAMTHEVCGSSAQCIDLSMLLDMQENEIRKL